MDEVAAVWNRHKIRSSGRNLPSGRPCVMYEVPSIFNTRSFLVDIDMHQLEAQRARCSFRETIPCDDDIFGFVCNILYELDETLPRTGDKAKQLYLQLRARARQLLGL